MNRLLPTVLALLMFSGCYFGSHHREKTVAYVMNGVAIVGGSVVIATADGGSCGDDPDHTCGIGRGAAGAAQALLGATFVAGGIIGIIINLATPTRADAAAATAPVPPAPAQASVTAPGLKSATVQVR